MSPIQNRPFIRDIAASAIGASLLLPIDSTPWLIALLQDLPFGPFGGWLWPLAGGGVTWLAYRMGVRVGIDRPAKFHRLADLQSLKHGSRHDDPEPEGGDIPSSTVVVPTLHGAPPELEDPLPEPVVQAALSLADATAAEVEHRSAQYRGQSATVGGTVVSVEAAFRNCVSVHLTLHDHDPEGKSATCSCWLDFDLSFAPAVKALAKGISVRAKGTVDRIGPEILFLRQCEFLRISAQ